MPTLLETLFGQPELVAPVPALGQAVPGSPLEAVAAQPAAGRPDPRRTTLRGVRGAQPAPLQPTGGFPDPQQPLIPLSGGVRG